MCKNIVKIFQKFEVGYIQTCTSLESNTMWHPKRGSLECAFTQIFDEDGNIGIGMG
jgi:hypothetical protein